MPTSLPVPTELEEGKTLAQWLALQRLRFTHIANESGYGTQAARIRGAKMKAQGTSPGFPDYIILVPPDRSRDGRGYVLAIELKRIKGSSISPDQLAWVGAFNMLDEHAVSAYICRGAGQAIKCVETYLRPGSSKVEF